MAEALTRDNLRKAFIWSLFLSWALMGIASILELHALFLILAPVAVMLFYLRYFHGLKDKELYQDQFADSFYSLGFLLTLTALVCTFFPLFYGNHEITMEETLGNFGVALLTTLFGLTVRIYMTSFSMDLEQLQKQTVLVLEKDVRLFKQEMGASIKVMQKFNAELETTTQKTVEDFGASLAGAGEEITSLVQVTMRDAFSPLSKTFADLSIEVEGATQSFGKDLDNSFKKCVESVDSIQLEPDMLGKAVRPALAGFEQVVRDIDQSVQTISSSLEKSSNYLDASMNDFSSSVGAMNSGLTHGLERLISKIENVEIDPAAFSKILDQAFQEFREAVSHVAEQTRDHGDSLEQSAESIRKALPAYDHLKTNMSDMVSLNEQMGTSINKLSSLTDIFNTMATNMQTLTSATDGYVQTMESSINAHKAKNLDLQQEHQSIKDVREKLEGQYKQAQSALEGLINAFVDIAQFVPRTLKDQA